MNGRSEFVRVSVIITTYKRSETLKRAVDSVLSQTISDVQLIVVDDNNAFDDDRQRTEKVMSSYLENPKVLYIKHEKNKNGASARNTGIRRVTGDYIAFLDDDDEFEPKRLETMCRHMNGLDCSWGACYSGYVKVMTDGNLQRSLECAEGNLLTQAIMRSLYIGSGSNLFFRKSVVDDVGFFDESFFNNQDLEYLVRVLEKYQMAYVDEALLIIHYDKRVKHISFDQIMERDCLFQEKFQYVIEKLSDEDKRRVRIMHGIDGMRMSISNKRYVHALNYIFERRIPPKILFKYALYMMDRKKNNSCYGFMF